MTLKCPALVSSASRFRSASLPRAERSFAHSSTAWDAGSQRIIARNTPISASCEANAKMQAPTPESYARKMVTA